MATLYAMGYSAKEMHEIFKEYCGSISYFQLSNILKFFLSKIFKNKVRVDGLNDGKVISKKVREFVERKCIYNISDIDMPLFIPSVDLRTRQFNCFYF